MSALLLFCGVQLLTVGLVGEYVGRMYLTANRRPQSVIRSVLRSAPAPKADPRRVGTRRWPVKLGCAAGQARARHRRPRLHRLQPRAPPGRARRRRPAASTAWSPSTAATCFNIAGIEDRVTVNVSDVRDEHSLRYLVRDRDYLFNLAGQTSHLDSMQDPFTDLEINCRAQLSILEVCRALQSRREDRLRQHAADLRPPRVPAGRREASAPPGRRERHQQDGRRVVPHPLQQRVRPARRRAAADQHHRPAHAGQGRAPDLRRRLGPQPARGRARSRSGAASSCATSTTSTTRSTPSCSPALSDDANGHVFNLAGETVDLAQGSGRAADRDRTAAAASRSVPFPEDRRRIDIGDYYADASLIRQRPRLGAARAAARGAARARSRSTASTSPHYL